jgi:hypothetical protein
MEWNKFMSNKIYERQFGAKWNEIKGGVRLYLRCKSRIDYKSARTQSVHVRNSITKDIFTFFYILFFYICEQILVLQTLGL